MIVQWCCRGVPDIGPDAVEAILGGGVGLVCRGWDGSALSLEEAYARLTEHHLDLHVNHHNAIDPDTGLEVRDVSPFISLSAGCVERRRLLRTNVVHPAERTALEFATGYGTHPGWVFTCWVLVGVNRATEVAAVAEEVRELNHARRYSSYFTEGEVAAKVNVPSRQILCAERWVPARRGGFALRGLCVNNAFVLPSAVGDERKML
jgi:hypothetical protein